MRLTALGVVRKAWTPLVLAAGISAIGICVAAWGTGTQQGIALQGLIYLVLVVGLYIFAGNSGVLQFGHIAFMAMGAYACAYLTIPPALKHSLFPEFPGFLAWLLDVELSFIPASLIAGALTAVIAMFLAVPLMRLDGVQAGIATFALLIVVSVCLTVTVTVTRGTSAIIGVPQFTTMTVAVVWGVIAIAVAYVYQQSRRGLLLRASREDAGAATAAGVDISFERGVAFTISGFFLGVGGALFAGFLTTFSPEAFYINTTFLTVAMLVIGGFESLTGAVTGVVFMSVVQEALRRVEVEGLGPIEGGALPGLTVVVLALILILILILRPSGISGGREVRVPAFLRAPAGHGTDRGSARLLVDEADEGSARSTREKLARRGQEG